MKLRRNAEMKDYFGYQEKVVIVTGASSGTVSYTHLDVYKRQV